MKVAILSCVFFALVIQWSSGQIQLEATLTLVELSEPVVGTDFYTVINSTSSNFFTGDYDENDENPGATPDVSETTTLSLKDSSTTAAEPEFFTSNATTNITAITSVFFNEAANDTMLVRTDILISSTSIASTGTSSVTIGLMDNTTSLDISSALSTSTDMGNSTTSTTSSVSSSVLADHNTSSTGAEALSTSTFSMTSPTTTSSVSSSALADQNTSSTFSLTSATTTSSVSSSALADHSTSSTFSFTSRSTTSRLMQTTSSRSVTMLKGTFTITSAKQLSTTSSIVPNTQISYQLEAPDVCYFNNTNNYCEMLNPENTSQCLVCLAGFIVNESNKRCEKCRAGTYWFLEDGNNASLERKCLPCEMGKSTNNLNGQVQCFECFLNTTTYGKTGMAKCEECDKNVSFTRMRGSPYCECVPGFYWNDLSKKCEMCAPGSFDSRESMQRPLNEYESFNIMECNPCAQGYYQSASGSVRCLGCEKGKYSNSTAATFCEWCPKDTFNDKENQTACTACKNNQYTPLLGSLFCFCGVGTYHERIQDCLPLCSCLSCDAGKYGLPKPSLSAAKINESLWSNVYEHIDWLQLTNSSVHCKNCDMGEYNRNKGATLCTDCEFGKYGDSTGLSVCLECVRGFSTTSRNTKKSDCKCDIGTFNQVPELECTFCPAGTFQENTNQTFCTQCQEGKFSNNIGMSENRCESCHLNFYNPHKGQASCLSCGAFAVTLSNGSTRTEECVCEEGTGKAPKSMNASVHCEICPSGTFQSSVAHTHCAPCGTGTFENGLKSTGCKFCPNGKYNDEVGRSFCLDCFTNNGLGFTSVSSGSSNRSDCRCVAGYIPNNEVCQPCARGSYQPNANGSTFCVLCSPGKSSDRLGRIDDCDVCRSGFYTNESGSAVCTPCYDGSPTLFRTAYVEGGAFSKDFCACNPGLIAQSVENGREACHPCPRGQFESQASCETCKAGQYSSEEGSTVCLWCALGKYNAKTGQSHCKSCHASAAANLGITLLTGAISHASCYCHIGTFFNTSADDDALEICELCPRGSYQSSFNATSCKLCAPGTFSNIEGNSNGCEECEKNYYNPFEGQAECKYCGTNQTTIKKGSLTIESCICSAGSYMSETLSNVSSGGMVCTLCPPGKFQHEANRSFCWDCDVGSTSTSAGATGYCQDCTKGSVRIFQNKTIFLSRDQMTTRTVFYTSEFCSLCRPGYYQPLDVPRSSRSGIQCIPCATGTYASESGSTVCLQCPNHTFGNQRGSQACSPCSPNSFTIGLGSSQCVCNAGSYLEVSSETCVFCSLGSFQMFTGKTLCTQCSVGSYLDITGGSEGCKRCPENSFNTWTGMSYCHECPPHSTTLGATGVDYCSCDAGYVPKESNSRECVACAVGTYGSRVNNVNRCELCALGSFSNATAMTFCFTCNENSFTSTTGLTACQACPSTTRLASSLQTCTCANGTEYGIRDSSGFIVACFPCNTTCSKNDEYIAEKCSIHKNTVCRPCSRECPPSHYRIKNCTLQNNLECLRCGSLCAKGSYVKQACKSDANIVCEYCTASCPKWFRIENACNDYNDLDCRMCNTGTFPDADNGYKSCRSCPDDMYISTRISSGASSSVHMFEYSCETCASGLVSANKTLCLASHVRCLPGEYPLSSKKCEFCPPNTFSSDGLGCKPCPIMFDCDPPSVIGNTECTPCNPETFLRENAKSPTKDTCAI